ncbi:replicative DNA helicase [Bacteroides sp. 519]|nr:replicative DNA helicase [Bacteroides sp. 519]
MKDKNLKEKPTFGNVIPQALDAERAVVGAVIAERNALDKVLFLTPEMFYDPPCRLLFKAVLSLQKKDNVVDYITVNQEIASMGQAEEVPLWFVSQIMTLVVSSAHIVEHGLIVKQKFLQREIIRVAMELQSRAYDDANDVGDVLFDAGKMIEALMETLVGKNEASSYSEISKLFYDDINLRIKRFNSGEQTGVTAGLTELNDMTSGWQGSELIILAARPAMGKTAMAMHFAQSAAQAGKQVVFFSLEMQKVQLYHRSVLSVCENLEPKNLKTGDLINDLENIDKAVSKLYELPIYVNDNSSINMGYIRSVSRLMHKKKQCDLIIIDYLQLITADKDKYSNREQDVAAMSRQAKLLAKELDVPVILLSQLNRDVERRSDKRPQLSDLRESGAIEQDADMVLFIHRPEYYGETVTDRNGNPVEHAGELIVAKYRNGSVGKVRFKHNQTLTRIFDYQQPKEIEQLSIF